MNCPVDTKFNIMGIVNVTPDSFSDGGEFLAVDTAVRHAVSLIEAGADILDVGGESSRPGASPIAIEEEIKRIKPVLRELAGRGVRLSVDTRNAATMREAIEAGADMINDISALTHDTESLKIVASNNVDVCLMHMKGSPQAMQDDPCYDNVVNEVIEFLKRRIDVCLDAGIGQNKIYIDPGIGFGKNLSQNLELLRNLHLFNKLGPPVLLGVSRKRFITGLAGDLLPKERMPGSIAACLAAYDAGIRMFRVHDVAETVQALKVYSSLTL